MSDRIITRWTAGMAVHLQEAYRESRETFAHRLGLHTRTVVLWHENPAAIPRATTQQLLDRALELAEPTIYARFLALEQEEQAPAPRPALDPVVAQMSADMALMQARMDQMQEQMGQMALRFMTGN
ncbi:hypothetical protein [Streptomyces sp. NPDC054849]